MRKSIRACTAFVLTAAIITGLGATAVHAQEPVKACKDETVYIMAGADGSQKKITVSDWLQNTARTPVLEDCSNLSDIENVKGEETYTAGKKGNLQWKANGNDIYYQGNSKEKTPVKLHITYELDGKKISPDQLAGKSGKVVIRFDYENTLQETVKIKNKKEKISAPFAAVTAMMLDPEHFRNVQVTNGKAENMGNEIAVLGIAFPGLQDSLNLKKEDLEIPEFVEITADVTGFQMEGTVTIVTTSFLKDMNTKDLSVDDLLDASRELTKGTNQLIDGAGKLSDGLATLLEKSGALVKGIDQLKDGSLQLKTGADALSGGAAQLKTGADQLSQGLATLSGNSASLRGGAQQVFNSLLSSATAQLKAKGIDVSLSMGNYGQVLGGVIDQLTNGAHEKALQQVTAAVEAKRPEIEAAVTQAVTQQVQAQVEEQVTAGVRGSVEEQVRSQTEVIRTQLISQFFEGMTPEEFDAAVESGDITPEDVEKLNAAVEAAVQKAVGDQIDSEAIRGQISAMVTETMASDDITAKIGGLVAESTENQVQKAISEAMASPEVQGQLQAAAEGAEAVTALKASLDSYNAFYLGVIEYTKGVDQASAGAKDVSAGAEKLKSGMDTLNTGAASLNEGISLMNEQAPALVDGVTQLKDGSVSLKNGLDQLMRDGIRKIADLAEDDLDNLVERIRACGELADSYNSFSGIHSGMDGTVKFIYRTDAIGN